MGVWNCNRCRRWAATALYCTSPSPSTLADRASRVLPLDVPGTPHIQPASSDASEACKQYNKWGRPAGWRRRVSPSQIPTATPQLAHATLHPCASPAASFAQSRPPRRPRPSDHLAGTRPLHVQVALPLVSVSRLSQGGKLGRKGRHRDEGTTHPPARRREEQQTVG